MLHVTSGSRLFIADAPLAALQPSAGALPQAGWIEVAELEALGLLGGQWDVDEADFGHMGNGSEGGEYVAAKRSKRTLPMQVILGLDPEDAGQLLLWQAYRVTDAYPFRLIFPGGVMSRTWWGLVTSIGEAFDAANSVMRLQVDILPCSNVER